MDLFESVWTLALAVRRIVLYWIDIDIDIRTA
jgi:hypothetical protein